jgi:hypothetical protein
MRIAIETAQRQPTMTAAAAVGALALLALLAWGWRAWRRRRATRRLVHAVTSIGFDHVRSVLVPDGNGGMMHVDFLLLTARGIVVVDLREVPGNVFGGDQMNEWTVMNGPRRGTFANPQVALYDRIAAVKALAGDVPVEGRILFTRIAKFPKGLPRWTLMLDSLGKEFPPADRQAFEQAIGHMRGGWERVKSAVTPSPLAPRLL